MVSAARVSQYLEGMQFPATKQDCVEYARRRNAPPDVMTVIQQLPDRQYFSLAGIWDALGHID